MKLNILSSSPQIFYALFMSASFCKADKIPFALLKRLVPERPIVLEAGAQFGEDTDWMSEFWSEGKIYSFEPYPEAYEQLCNVAKKHENISPEQCALTNKVGEMHFYKAGGASSLLKPIYGFYDHDGTPAATIKPITVKTTTIDEWAVRNGITHIDFMWLDMEGNELNALNGSLSLLKRVKVIFTEVNLQRFWEGCVLYHEIKQWLEAQGFEKVWDDVAPNWRGNALFINKNLE